MITLTNQPTNPPHNAYNNSVIEFKVDGDNNLIQDSEVNVGPTGNQSMHVYQLHRSIPNGTEVKISMKANLGKDYFGFFSSQGNTYVNEVWPAHESGGIFEKVFIWNGGSSKNLTVYQYGASGESSIDWIRLEETAEDAIPLIMPTAANITAGGHTFEIFPDASGNFYFNFKPIIGALINQDRFRDTIIPDTFLKFDSSLYYDLAATIEVVLEEGEPVSTEVNLPFLKSVKQKGERPFHDSELKILTPNATEVAFLTFFAGYPFDLSIYSDTDRAVTIKNVNTGMQTVQNFSKGVNRLFISNGEIGNENSFENELPLHYGVNELEFIKDGDIHFTLFLNKREAECGHVLKWLNPQGGWSYWRFLSLYRDDVKTSTKDHIKRDYGNLNFTDSNISITGKNANIEWQLQSGNLDQHEKAVLQSMVMSPKVYLYSNELYQPYELYDFVEVELKDTTYSNTNKMKIGQFNPVILMPSTYTQSM